MDHLDPTLITSVMPSYAIAPCNTPCCIYNPT